MEHGPKVIRDAGLLDRLSALGRWFGDARGGPVPLPGYVTTVGAGTRCLAWDGIKLYCLVTSPPGDFKYKHADLGGVELRAREQDDPDRVRSYCVQRLALSIHFILIRNC